MCALVCFLLLCSSAIVHSDSGLPLTCEPRLDQFSMKFSVEQLIRSASATKHIVLGDIILDRTAEVDIDNMSLAIEYATINGTCGGFASSQRCEPFDESKVTPYLLVREITGDDIAYLEMSLNTTPQAQNKFSLGGNDYSLITGDTVILGSCVSTDGLYCQDGTDENGCLPQKPGVCGRSSPYAQVCGCLPFYVQDGNNCYRPDCVEGAVKDRTCQFNGEVLNSKIVHTECVRGEWVKYRVDEDCSAENLTCMVMQNRAAQCVNFTCEDGTKFGTCSADKPKFCGLNGVFGDDVVRCGCNAGSVPDAARVGCVPFACKDGTPVGECSATKPLFCSGGSLIENPDMCGQPENKSNLSGKAAEAGAGAPAEAINNSAAAPVQAAPQNGQAAPSGDGSVYIYAAIAVLAAAIIAAYYLMNRPKAGAV